MKKALFILFTTLMLSNLLVAQTPPAKTWFYNNKGVKTSVKEKWSEDNHGLKHGTYIKYFEDGEREILGYYNQDKPNGQWEITVYSNMLFQQVKSITYVNFLNGQEHGLYKTVMGSTILVQGNYTNGVKTGYWKDDYNIDDKVYSEGSYVNGKRNGEWKNTLVTKKSKEEMGWSILAGDGNPEKTETKKGCKTIYKNGEAIASYDDKGVNVIEKAKQEELVAQQKQIEAEFKSCITLSDFENFRKKYPNSEFDSDAIIQINKLRKEYEKQRKEEEKNKPDNDAFNSADNINDYLKYEKDFPNGIHISEIQEQLKVMVLKNLNPLFKEIPLKYFANGNISEAIVNCELILRFKDNIDESYYLPTIIYYSLALWSKGDKDKAISVLRPEWNTVIHYSNENVKFKDSFFSIYNQYKTQLNIDKDKDTYKRIKAL